jgi:thiosulfate reductase cytochrome b subunit
VSKSRIYRHSILVRATHVLNAIALALLLMSGLQIFNAHPALYWGERSDFERPLLSISNSFTAEGRPVGITTIFGVAFQTTGVLGWSRLNGRPGPRAFPGWMTIPSIQDLATGRLWHFLVAWLFALNGVVYLGYSVAGGHFGRDLLPRSGEWRHVGRVLATPLSHQTVEGSSPEAPRYNIVQKLAYLGLTLILAPLTVMTGLALSPAIGAAAPWLIAMFGGRQSARTLHFALTWLLLLFVIVHVAMVVLTGILGGGLINGVRSMITGWYAVPGNAAGDVSRPVAPATAGRAIGELEP